MPTSSIFHNFVITDRESAERFLEAFDRPKIQRSDIDVEMVSGAENIKLLVEKWKKSIKQDSQD